MAIMPKGKLAAWMGRGAGGGKNGGGMPPKKGPPGAPPGRGAPPPRKGPPGGQRGPGGQGAPPDPTEDQPDVMHGEEGEQPTGEERYFPIMEWLEESGPLLEDAAQGMDPAGLMDEEAELDPATAEAIHMLMPDLPPELTDGMTELAEGATFQDCMTIGAHMQREGWVVDGDVVGGLLWRIFNVLAAPPPTQEQHAAQKAVTGPRPAPGPGGGAPGGAGGGGAAPAGAAGAPGATR